uniref:DC1 domain-containing protein n=1 Tax=Brassica campestris TaxID=3711 RepID=M4EGL9_BRACM
MEVSALKLPIHKHRLYPSTRFLYARCEGCRVRGHIYGGYRCNDSGCYNNANPGGWFHKECGESPSEINHPSHPEHPLTFNAKTDESDASNADEEDAEDDDESGASRQVPWERFLIRLDWLFKIGYC